MVRQSMIAAARRNERILDAIHSCEDRVCLALFDCEQWLMTSKNGQMVGRDFFGLVRRLAADILSLVSNFLHLLFFTPLHNFFCRQAWRYSEAAKLGIARKQARQSEQQEARQGRRSMIASGRRWERCAQFVDKTLGHSARIAMRLCAWFVERAEREGTSWLVQKACNCAAWTTSIYCGFAFGTAIGYQVIFQEEAEYAYQHALRGQPKPAGLNA
jgi:hypothetical protein